MLYSTVSCCWCQQTPATANIGGLDPWLVVGGCFLGCFGLREIQFTYSKTMYPYEPIKDVGAVCLLLQHTLGLGDWNAYCVASLYCQRWSSILFLPGLSMTHNSHVQRWVVALYRSPWSNQFMWIFLCSSESGLCFSPSSWGRAP